jgi:hypothetical protein
MAYLDCYRAEPEQARAIAARYADYPVDRWRNSFLDVLNLLNEAEGHGAKVADAENQVQRQGQLAATEPGFEFTLDSRQIHLTWQHLELVRVNAAGSLPRSSPECLPHGESEADDLHLIAQLKAVQPPRRGQDQAIPPPAVQFVGQTASDARIVWPTAAGELLAVLRRASRSASPGASGLRPRYCW